MVANIVKYILEILDKGATKSLKDVGKASEKTTKDLKKMQKESAASEKALKNLAKGSAVLGAAVLAGAAAFVSFGQKQADIINDLNDLSTRSGMAANSIQALQFAFVASGQSADSVQQLVDKMPKLMSELARQTGKSSEAAKKLGVEAFDPLTGKLRNSQVVFMDLTKALQSIEGGTERATLAADLFGRQAGNMLQAFGQTEGLQTFLDFTNKWGVDVGPEASKQAAQFQQMISILQTVIKEFGQTFSQIFGEKGFVSPLLFAAKSIVFMSKSIELSLEDQKMSFDLWSAFVEKRSLQVKLAMLQVQEAWAAITLDNKKVVQLTFAMREAQTELDTVNEKITDLSLSSLAMDLEGGIFDQASASANEFEKDALSLLDELGKAGEAVGSVLGENIEGAADLASKAWKEFFNVLNDIEKFKTDAFDSIGDSMLLAAANLEEHFDKIVERAEKISGVLSGIATGDIVGAASQFMGPIGGAVAGGVSAISDIGQRIEEEGTEFIKLDIENFVRGFVIGLAALPAILIEVLPPLLFEAAGRIVVAIIQLPIHIARAIADVWNSTFGKEAREGRRETRQRRREEEGVGANLRHAASAIGEFLVSGAMMGGGRFIPSAMDGMRFTGNRRGLAMLHENEIVTPASGQMPQGVARQFQGSGGGVSININAEIVERNAIDELVRRIERQFDMFGTSTSPLFNRG